MLQLEVRNRISHRFSLSITQDVLKVERNNQSLDNKSECTLRACVTVQAKHFGKLSMVVPCLYW